MDPKGTSNAEYQNKVDEFEKLFSQEGNSKVFTHKGCDISFDLRLVDQDVNAIGEKYEKYWFGNEDFLLYKSNNQRI